MRRRAYTTGPTSGSLRAQSTGRSGTRMSGS